MNTLTKQMMHFFSEIREELSILRKVAGTDMDSLKLVGSWTLRVDEILAMDDLNKMVMQAIVLIDEIGEHPELEGDIAAEFHLHPIFFGLDLSGYKVIELPDED